MDLDTKSINSDLNKWIYKISKLGPQQMAFDTTSAASDLDKWISTQNQQNRTSKTGFRHNISKIGPRHMEFNTKSSRIGPRQMDFDTTKKGPPQMTHKARTLKGVR